MKPWLIPKRKMKAVISGFQHKMKIHIFTIPFAWTAPESLWLILFSDEASLKYCLVDSTQNTSMTYVILQPSPDAPVSIKLISCYVILYISDTQSLPMHCRIYHERRSFAPCCVLCLTGCLESYRCSIEVCPMSDPFIYMNINKYLWKVFKIVPGTHSGPN